MKKSHNQATSRDAAREKNREPALSVKLIKDVLRNGITVTIGGVPVVISLGAEGAATVPAAAPASKAAPASRAQGSRAPASQVAKPRRKLRRRKSRRLVLPDSREVRGYLAMRQEGSTLTALAQAFQVKRPLMKRLLTRMLARGEVTQFKGAFYNSKRLRQRRIGNRTDTTTETQKPQAQAPAPESAEAAPEAETHPATSNDPSESSGGPDDEGGLPMAASGNSEPGRW